MFCPACHEVEFRDERQPIPDEDGHVVWGTDLRFYDRDYHYQFKNNPIYMATRAILEYTMHSYYQPWVEYVFNTIKDVTLARKSDEMDFRAALEQIKEIVEDCQQAHEYLALNKIEEICDEALANKEEQEGSDTDTTNMPHLFRELPSPPLDG